MRLFHFMRRRNAELDEEIAMHIQMAVSARMKAGESEAEARAAVRREFGSELLVREATRSMWSFAWLERLVHDYVIAMRSLWRTRRFFVSATICMAVGIAVTTTILSAVHSILLRPLPYANAEQVVALRAFSPKILGGEEVTQEALNAWRRSKNFARVGGWRLEPQVLSDAEDAPERVSAAAITSEIPSILGVRAMYGRSIDEADEREERNVAMISYDLWRRRFGGDPKVVGTTTTLNGRPHEIIGVMPAGFSFPEGADAWRPLKYEKGLPTDILYYDGVIAERRPGVTVEQARAEFTALTNQMLTETRAYKEWRFEARTLREDLTGALRKPVLIFQGGALLVLLIACANIASLLLARGAARDREFSVRSAIGASRSRLASQVLVECAALATIGGALGIALAYWGVRLLRLAFVDGVPSYINLTVHTPVLVAAVAITFLSAMLFGSAPSLLASRAKGSLATSAAQRGGGVSTRARTRSRNWLVAAEIAASVILMSGGVLLARSAQQLESGLGFRPAGLLSVRVPLPWREFSDESKRLTFYQTLEQRVRALPGVDEVSFIVSEMPLDGASQGYQRFSIDGETNEHYEDQKVITRYVEPGFAKALGAPIVQGRDATRKSVKAPDEYGEFEALVNETFARAYFGTESPVGRVVRLAKPGAKAAGFRIVGVVADIRHSRPPATVEPALYQSGYALVLDQTLIVHTKDEHPEQLAPAIRQIVAEIDNRVVADRIQSQSHVVARAFWRERLQRNVIMIFAALSLMLALFGMYGVLSYAVAQRTSELGVRIALGASRNQLLMLVLREGLKVAVIGVVAGVALSLMMTRVLSGLLYGVSATDPITFIAVTVVILPVAMIAAIGPARRAAGLDPVKAIAGG